MDLLKPGLSFLCVVHCYLKAAAVTMGCMLEVLNSLLSAGYVLAGALALTDSDTSPPCTETQPEKLHDLW